MRGLACLASCGLLLLGACAEVPPQPAAPAAIPAPTAAGNEVAAAVADHRVRARRHARSGDHAAALREWQIVLLLSPADDDAKTELEATRAAIRSGVRTNLQAGNQALRSGDAERATAAMLRVLALDPANSEATTALRDLDRQKQNRIQSRSAARASQASTAGTAAAGRTAPAAAATPDGVESYEIEQGVEIFRAGDIEGGLREFRALVDADPSNDAARLRLATLVYERSLEAEQKGARELALRLCEQAASLRGKPVPAWNARAQSLRKTLSADYYELGVRVFRTDLAAAIRFWETSVSFDPQNRNARTRLQEARIADEKLKRIEQEAKPR